MQPQVLAFLPIILEGILQINDNSLQFDNRLYFSLQQNEKIKVAAISYADDALEKKNTETEFGESH